MRQYEVRDFLRRQAESEEALRRSEKLAVAGRLAASVAHEINNPLTAVTNLLFLVRSAGDLEEAHHYARLAEDELRRVSEIANHNLRFHRSSKGPEKVDVAELLNSALVIFRAKLKNQSINVQVECNERCNVICSLGEIRQVLVNLISNAIEVMRGGGALLVRASAVPHPSTGVPGVRISVVDHGEGISPRVYHRLFEPFFTTKGVPDWDYGSPKTSSSNTAASYALAIIAARAAPSFLFGFRKSRRVVKIVAMLPQLESDDEGFTLSCYRG